MNTLSKKIKLNSQQELARENSRNLKEAITRIRELEKELGAKQLVSQRIKTHTIKPSEHHGEGQAIAIAIASDWHVGEVVKPSTVSGLNKYNPEIARSRADTFFRGVARLTAKEEQDIHIDTIVLGLLGDFITGRIHEENLETTALRPIEETMFAQELIASGIQYLLKNTNKNLVIPCVCGNHSRITRKVHASTEYGNSLETFMYHALQSHFQNEPRVKFVIGEGYHVYLDVFGSQLRFHHGHAIGYQGGIGGLTIPLIKAIHSWNLTKVAKQDFLGHFHQYTPHRRFMVNGSLIGYNAFALRIKAEYEPPQQVFCLWDKKRGKTVTMPILFST